MPADTALERMDILAGYGAYYYGLSMPAIDKVGESLDNSEMFRRLAEKMGYTEDCFSQTDEEMIEVFNKSKIVLGFATVGSNDDIYILKGRDFEVPLTGSFYITGNHDELKEYFNTGKDIETYTSKEDLLKKNQILFRKRRRKRKYCTSRLFKVFK